MDLKTILPSPFVLHYTNKLLRLLTCWGLKRGFADARGLSLLPHICLNGINRGRPGLFAFFTLSHTPFRTFAWHHNTLTSVFPCTALEWGFIQKDAWLCEFEERGASLSSTSFVKFQILSTIIDRLSDIVSWLIRGLSTEWLKANRVKLRIREQSS